MRIKDRYCFMRHLFQLGERQLKWTCNAPSDSQRNGRPGFLSMRTSLGTGHRNEQEKNRGYPAEF